MPSGAVFQRGWLFVWLLLVGVVRAEPCVGVVPAGGQQFWHTVQAGAEQAARDLHVELYFRGPAHEGDGDAQKKVIDLIVQRGCGALVIAPATAEIAEQAARLKQSGIPTVYIDRDMGGEEVLAVIGTDNYKAGEQAGHYLVQALGGHGRVAVVRLARGVVSTTAREEGFLHAVHGAGLEVVFDRYLGDDAQAVLAGLRDQVSAIDAIFAPNGTSAGAVYAALKRLHVQDRVKLLGFDSSTSLLEALQHGEIIGLLLQQPYQMGYRGVTLAVQAMRGQARVVTERLQVLPVVLATPGNLNEPQVAALLQ